MSVSTIHVSIIPTKSDDEKKLEVQISRQILEHFKINTNRDLTLQIGKKIITITVRALQIPSYEIHLPKNILKDFSLPIQTYQLQASYYAENRILYLGPVIGLLTDFNKNNDAPHFRSIHSFSEELHHGFSNFGGFLYVFAFMDLSEKGVSGYYFDNGKWVASELPLPDVIYNRIHSRKLEHAKNFKSFRKDLEKLNIPFFNDRFLSKWEVHEQLMKQEQLLPYIPETQILSKENLKTFFDKYQTVFIKPVHGSQGRNIIKVMKENNHFMYQTSQNSNSELMIKKQSIDEIFQDIKPLLNNRINIIQQGIYLSAHQTRAMDFRVLCHKNKLNEWDVTSLVARISAEKQFVSNVARGGQIMKPAIALGYLFEPKKVRKILAEMKKLSISAATIISNNSSGITGELGIDIGVDQEGQIWIIEVNSKPSKNFDDNQTKIRPSAKAIIQFCQRIALEVGMKKEE